MPIGGTGGSGGASAGQVKAGGAYVSIGSVTTGLEKGLARAKALVMGLASTLKGIGVASLGLGGALAAPLALLFKGGLDRTAKVGELAEQFNLTADAASRLAAAAEGGGATIEDLAEALKGLAQRDNTGAPMGALLMDALDALNQIPDGANRAKLAMDSMGEGAIKLLRGARGFRDRFNAATPITDEQVQQARATQAAWTNAITSLQQGLLPLLQIVAPVAGWFARWAKENAGLMVALAAVATGLIVFGKVALLASVSLSAVLTVLGVLKAAFWLLLTPIGLASVAVAALAYTIATRTQEGGQALDFLKSSFAALGDIFSETWKGVINAVKAGDLELAFKIVGVGVQTVWAQVMLSLRKGWNDFMSWTVDALRRNPWILPLIGGIVGGLTGGPTGALIGATAGAAGAVGIEFFADEIKNALTADTTEAANKLAKLKAELAGLGKQAATAAGNATPARPDLAYMNKAVKAFEQVKGSFDTFRSSAQRFGYGDSRKTLDVLNMIANGQGKAPAVFGSAVANAMAAK